MAPVTPTKPPKPLPEGRHSVRIIAGGWRGRRVNFPDLPGLRPTPDRVRETLFNWLQHAIVGARICQKNGESADVVHAVEAHHEDIEQRTVEAISCIQLHRQNFRRLVEDQGLVEGTGKSVRIARGRPAELFRFRREVLGERPAPGVRLGSRRAAG